jgi:hypothetical protein
MDDSQISKAAPRDRRGGERRVAERPLTAPDKRRSERRSERDRRSTPRG